MNPESISQIIRKRRTLKPKQMDSREIDRKVLMQIFEDANWAPTHGMTEPWRFVIYTGEARKKLANFLAETYQKIVPPDEFKPTKYENFRVNPTLAPVVVAIGMKRQEIGKIPEIEEVEAVACAIQNLHLSATSHGIGGFWSSNVAATSDQMREYVGLGEQDRVLGLFYLGYPSVPWPESQRGPIEDKLSWIDC